jgi:membrane protease subunit (stomatin/prohibitin family)
MTKASGGRLRVLPTDAAMLPNEGHIAVVLGDAAVYVALMMPVAFVAPVTSS